jgi:hypothetical protein
VWWEGKRPSARDGNNEESFFQVRVLRRFRQDQGGSVPREDTAELLERTAELLEDALASVLARPWLEQVSGEDLSGFADFFTVTELSTSYTGQYVQAAIQAWARNRTARGG